MMSILRLSELDEEAALTRNVKIQSPTATGDI